MNAHDYITLAVSFVTTAFICGTVWGVTKAQTEDLKEGLRHHLHTEHPRLDAAARETEKDLAVLKVRSQSWVDREERNR